MNETPDYSIQAARSFAEKYKTATSEKQLAQSFWRDFFHLIFGIDDLLATGIEFEHPVRSSETGQTNFIDVFWSGVVLIEHKSAGKDLNLAEKQARDYLISLPIAARPPAIVLSDFSRFRVIEVLAGQSYDFVLDDLPDNLHRFATIIGSRGKASATAEISADIKAAQLMADLYVEFEKAGYEGHQVSVFLVRILFLNFGDDTRMWRRVGHGLFAELIATSPESGTGLGGTIQELFQVLDTPKEKRPTTLSAEFSDFPYINGQLFSEQLPTFSFTPAMREALLRAAHYDWSKISPAIFGSLFEAAQDKQRRRNLGQHFTSEANILKLIRPLFLDDFLDRLHKSWDSASALRKLRIDLGKPNFLDPAAGSGNFLVVAYKRLREIELKILARLQELEGTQGQVQLDGTMGLQVHLGQFHAIEYEEWSSQIARVAMFLADHQANLALEEITGAAPNRFPLVESAVIRHGNALTTDWAEVCPMNADTFIMGNPPFFGARFQTPEQKEETVSTWNNINGVGALDYVSNWFRIGAEHASSSGVHVAFVSTNSISQGEQPAIIWGQLHQLGVYIDFAHRTFVWSNDAKGQAAVHTVIIGFSAGVKKGKRQLWLYPHQKSAPELVMASNINGYLVDAPDILMTKRSQPLVAGTPKMDFGSMPNDGGYLSTISEEEASAIRANDPVSASYLRKIVGGQELINNEVRYCLWLVGADPSHIRTSPELSNRVSAVRKVREESKREATRKLANRPAEFAEIRQPTTPYIAVPLISSENRDYVPMAWLQPEVISNNKIGIIAKASLATFGLMSSKPFNAWNRAVSGRLKSDLNISITITYNNFPFLALTKEQEQKISAAANAVLDARAEFPNNSLADLYHRDSMPMSVRQAHAKLDAVVMPLYGLKATATEEQVIERLFTLFQEINGELFASEPVKPTKAKKA
jgi:hypothetical protein